MRANTLWWLCVSAAIVFLNVAPTNAESPYQLTWQRQFGSSDPEQSCGVSADGLGSVYVSGTTWGSLGGTNAGGHDAFLAKYDVAGNMAWSQQLGTSADDDVYHAVSADRLGNVYIGGATFGSLDGTNAGNQDAFLAKYNANGSLVWCRQLGTAGLDQCQGVAADRLGNVFISGITDDSLGGSNAGGVDTFISKYDVNGTRVWSQQLGTAGSDYNTGLSADGLGNVYVTGYDDGGVAYVAKYDSAGTLAWNRQLGAGGGRAWGISADSQGNVFVSGDTTASLAGPNLGGYDLFVAKYDALGDLKWCRQFGTTESDLDAVVSADGQGNAYVAATTLGSLGGTNAGDWDATLTKLDASGDLLWSCQFGADLPDGAMGVSADGLGHVYLSGDRAKATGAYDDLFLASYTVPEPPAYLLASSAAALLALYAQRRKRTSR